MRIGIALPNTSSREVAAAAETAGFDSVWAGDQLLGAGAVDPIGALHEAAGATTHIALGTAVLAAPWYPPVVLARGLATLDRASDGRLRIGLGLGRSNAAHEAAGVRRRFRGAQMDELLDVLAAAWGPDPVSYIGARIKLTNATVQPKPVQGPRPPLLLAASTPSGLDRIARRADGWITAGLPADSVAPMWRAIRELAGGYGRDPETLQLVVVTDVDAVEGVAAVTPDEVVLRTGRATGDVDELVECYAEARGRLLGATHDADLAAARPELDRVS